MVRKLGLQRLKHLTPYVIIWFQDDGSLQVREQWSVNYSISPFNDEVYCDVVDMSACHVLLWIPWKLDRGAIHDYGKNTATIEKDGKKFGLIPFKMRKTEKIRT